MNAPSATPDLAEAAAFEVGSRERHYPAMIEAGEIKRAEAAADLDAWRAIAAMLALPRGADADGRVGNPRLQAGTEIPWPALAAAAGRALERQTRRAEAARGDARAAQRHDALRAIHYVIVAEAWFWNGGRGPRPISAVRTAA
ncbi:MAG TPA: hypothetical protein VN231_05880 [Allosphingosinicella sp.]|nr:hypothetical protein [Allosphingosinicella sp.]